MNEIVVCIAAGRGYDRAAQGALGAGQRLAEQMQGPLHALVLGSASSGEPELLQGVGAASDRVTIAEGMDVADYQPEPWLTGLAGLLRQWQPRAVLLGNDVYSQELAPRLAHRLGGSAVGDALALACDAGEVRVTRSVYGGKAQAVIALRRSPAVVWIRARAFEPARPRSEGVQEPERVSMDGVDGVNSNPATRIVERKTEVGGDGRLEDAAVIISGGRGLGGPEPFEQLKEVAARLGGQVAASRAACDSGWVPPSWQVGQTGKKVAPELYLAVAIHGASQHLAGISDARVVSAINIDPDAPIFKHCQFGIVEDYRKVVPLLLEKLAALQE